VRIASIKLKNFKRFTDLVIKNIPETSKLVVIVGPNGSGKSSLFDALIQWYRGKVGFGYINDQLYYRKDSSQIFEFQESVSVTLHGSDTPNRSSVYVRTAYRNDPDFSISGFGRLDIPSESLRITKAIENDQTVRENFQRLVYDTMAGVYNSDNDAKSVLQLREELIGQIRTSMKAVFGDLLLNNISAPLENGSFYFEKGAIKNYHYKNLSGGEKAAFDLLLDLHIKKKFYENAIYCIDEIETHLHTKIQGLLLKEMVDLLPDKSQLWITTHSLGVMRAALDLATQNPGSVSVIDFDGVDPDIPREIEPSNLGRITWEKLLSIALDDLSVRMAPKYVIICEGSSIGSRRKDFDAEIYNRIFRQAISDVVFISGGSSNQVQATGVSVATALASILPGAGVCSLMDRDDKSIDEVRRLRQQGNLVLEQRNIESYLFEDEVIEALVISTNQPTLIPVAIQIKQEELTASIARGNPPDDLKSAAGNIYTRLKALLQLTRCGNNKDEFMRDTLAPLINPAMQCYTDLKAIIIDPLP
jgi:energy-coupling factor transporter ATP-binding protein EcfA2